MAEPAFVAPNPLYGFTTVFFDTLSHAGLRHVVVCPGSRSAPLAVSAGRTQGLRCWPVVDERSAGFFALGLARALRTPVAVLCTSGTAVANLLPAVVEAHHSRVPLLLLTADRPPELRDCGAGQTIDQVGLFGSRTRWFHDVLVPSADLDPDWLVGQARNLASRGYAVSQGAVPGPVHLNFPFREPLDPSPWGAAWMARRDKDGVEQPPGAAVEVPDSHRVVAPETLAAMVQTAGEVSRGWIVCGPMDAREEEVRALARLSRATGWPILADATSGIRFHPAASGATVVCGADLLLRDEAFRRRMAPDLVLRFGDAPVSKSYRLSLEALHPKHTWLVDPSGSWLESSRLASVVLAADPVSFCETFSCLLEANARQRDPAWESAWKTADTKVRTLLADRIDDDPDLGEARLAREVVRGLPSGGCLVVGNSMPVRDMEAFAFEADVEIRVLANRGASGIDGTVSTALGASAGHGGPTVLFCGDLSFVHDLGGWWMAREAGVAVIAVIANNDGGGIFSFLPIAEHGEGVRFEELFRVPHGLDFSHVADLFGIHFARVTSWGEFHETYDEALGSGQSAVIEVPVDRDADVKRFKDHVRAVSEGVSSFLDDGV